MRTVSLVNRLPHTVLERLGAGRRLVFVGQSAGKLPDGAETVVVVNAVLLHQGSLFSRHDLGGRHPVGEAHLLKHVHRTDVDQQ